MKFIVAVASGFAGGVLLRSLFIFSWEPIVFALLVAALFSVATLLKPRLMYSLGAFFCMFIALGMVRTSLADTPLPHSFAGDLRHRVSFEGVIVADPDVRDANQRVEIKISRGNESTVMLAVAPRYPTVAVGDHVFVSGTLQAPEPFIDDSGRLFRYDKYLERDGVRFILNFAYLRVIENAPWYSLPAELARLKHFFLDGLSATLPEPYASLAGGIVIGGKSGLGKELQHAFIRSGIIQIIVLSGYNVMVVAQWVMAFLVFVKMPRRASTIAGALALLVFVGIAGVSATALRAALMALIALYARATGRSYAAGRALFFVVLLMLMWNPLYLVYDPGFGLSVAATAGLIWLAPIIETMLQARKKDMLRVTPHATFRTGNVERSQHVFLSNVLATTLAAQIAVLPLLLYDTGNLSLVAIPANVLTMPIVPLAMGFSVLAGFAGMFLPAFFGVILGLPAYLATAYLLIVARTSADLPFAAFTLPLFPFWLVFLAYAALIYFVSSKRFSTTLQLRFAKNASI